MAANDPSELGEFTPRDDVEAYFVPRDDVPSGAPEGARLFDPTIHVQGAWNEHEQHLAASAGLMVHCIEQHEAREDMQLAKVTFDVYGFIPLRPTLVHVRTIRPGRTIELVEAEFTVDGRTIIVARAWRLSKQDSSPVAGADLEPMPPIEQCERFEMSDMWPGGFIRSVERFDAPPGYVPGRNRVWLRTKLPVVLGEDVSATTHFLSVIDGANGIAVREDPRAWMFPNVDLTVHLMREPDPSATGFDTTVGMGETGLGITMTTLHDIHGPVGRVAQSLTVRPMPTKG